MYIVKMFELVFMFIGLYLVVGIVYLFLVYLFLFFVIVGVVIASVIEFFFTWLGFLMVMSFNIVFFVCVIFSKKFMSKMFLFNLYNWVIIVVLFFCLSFVVYFEGSTFSAGISKVIVVKGKMEFFMVFVFVGFYYYMYN